MGAFEPVPSGLTPMAAAAARNALPRSGGITPAAFGSSPTKPRLPAQERCALPLMCSRKAASPDESMLQAAHLKYLSKPPPIARPPLPPRRRFGATPKAKAGGAATAGRTGIIGGGGGIGGPAAGLELRLLLLLLLLLLEWLLLRLRFLELSCLLRFLCLLRFSCLPERCFLSRLLDEDLCREDDLCFFLCFFESLWSLSMSRLRLLASLARASPCSICFAFVLS